MIGSSLWMGFPLGLPLTQAFAGAGSSPLPASGEGIG